MKINIQKDIYMLTNFSPQSMGWQSQDTTELLYWTEPTFCTSNKKMLKDQIKKQQINIAVLCWA